MFRIGVVLAVAAIFGGANLPAASLNFSGSLTGTAIEDPAGRCAPFITVDAGGTGSSNVLGAFSDQQSHCTTGLSTFSSGIFTLSSLSQPADSLRGVYSGTASVAPGNILDFSAVLTVQNGSGRFAGASGSLDSSGTLDSTGVFKASFDGLITPVPEPGGFPLPVLGLSFLCGGYLLRRRLSFKRPQPVNSGLR